MILVTGANGLLGSHICKTLADKGYEVIALVRESSNMQLLAGYENKLRIELGDILDPIGLKTILKGVDTIIHSAALVSFDPKDKDKMTSVNVIGTKNLVDLALTNEINYFIHISSVAAIGRNNKKATVSESTQWQNSKYNTSYGESKYYAELEVWRGIQESLKAVILNPSVILAAGDASRSSSQLLKYVWNESRYYPNGDLNYVDIDDVVKAILMLLEKKITGERFILSAGTDSYKNILEKISKLLNKKAPDKLLTGGLLKAVIFLERIRSRVMNRAPLITKESAMASATMVNFDSSKIKTTLDFKFTDLSSTLNRVCAEALEKFKSKN